MVRMLGGLMILFFMACAWAAELPGGLTAREAIRRALTENPDLTVARQRREIAAAGIVLARIYPQNPVLSLTPRGASGPSGAVTHNFTIDASLTQEVEIHGQGRLRRQAAQETLSRTEWEIAAQELAVVGKTLRAFNTVVYRLTKEQLLIDNVRLSENALDTMKTLVRKKKEKLPAGELVLLQFEIQEARAQRVSGRGPRVAAEQELRQLLGGSEFPQVEGTLQIVNRQPSVTELQARAQSLRPDLQAKRLALAEASSALSLQHASRFGNPAVGPCFSTNETGVYFMGATFGLPLPLRNRKQGEISQRQAELNRATLELRQTEIQIDQEIGSALARLNETQELIRLYRDEYLPALKVRSEELEKLYSQEDSGVDVQQVLELRRRLIKAQENYVDALYDHGQIEVDLAMAVGDLELALDPEP